MNHDQPMKQSYFIFLLFQVAFLLLLSGCGKSETPPGDDENEQPGKKIPIGFSSSVLPVTNTRAGSVITDIAKMYVFANYTGSADWQTTHIPNFMYNQLMTKGADNAWTYTPVKYWPNTSGEKISFFAYAPTDITGMALSAKTAAGPILTYTVPTQENSEHDLLLASAMNKQKTDGTISFSMAHALSQIKFCVKSGDTGSTKILKGLTVKAPGIGSASFTADGNFVWTIDATNINKLASFVAEETFKNGATVAIPENTAGKTDILATFFLLPVGDASRFTVSLTYTLQKTGETTATELTASTRFPASPKWTPGSNIIYTVTIVDDRLEEIGGVTVASFEEGTTAGTGDEITAT